MLANKAGTRQHNKILVSGTIGAFRLCSDNRISCGPTENTVSRQHHVSSYCAPPPPPPRGHILRKPQVLKAPEKMVSLTNWRRRCQRKSLIGPRHGSKIWPNHLGGGRGGGGPGGSPPPPPPVGTYLVHRGQKIYWATNHSAHGNVILLVANKANSSLQVNSGFPHLSGAELLSAIEGPAAHCPAAPEAANTSPIQVRNTPVALAPRGMGGRTYLGPGGGALRGGAGGGSWDTAQGLHIKCRAAADVSGGPASATVGVCAGARTHCGVCGAGGGGGGAGILLSRGGGGRGGGGFGPKTWCTKNGLTRFSLL